MNVYTSRRKATIWYSRNSRIWYCSILGNREDFIGAGNTPLDALNDWKKQHGR